MKSLAEYAFEIERVCHEAAFSEEGLTDEMVLALSELEGNVAEKTDNWIGYLDSLKGRIADLEEKTNRFSMALRVAKNLEKRLKNHLVNILENTPNVSYKGELGSLKIQKNSSAKLTSDLTEVSVRFEYINRNDAVFSFLNWAEIEPYLERKEYWILKKNAVKNDLKIGKEIEWAKLEQGNHLRIKV